MAEGETVWHESYLAEAFIRCRPFLGCITEANAEGLDFFVAILLLQLNPFIRLQDFENVFVS